MNVRAFGLAVILIGTIGGGLLAAPVSKSDATAAAKNAKFPVGDKVDPDAPVKELSAEEQALIMKQVDTARQRTRIADVRKSIPAAAWIDIAYHGQLFDANYEVLAIDASMARVIQDSMFLILSAGMDQPSLKKARLAKLTKLFTAKDMTPAEQLIVRSSIIDALLDAAPEKLSLRYRWRHQLLQREIRIMAGDLQTQIHPDILRRLRDYHIRPDWFIPATPSNAYNDECRANSVPVPPNFPDARWRSQGVQGVTFIGAGSIAEPFAYRNDDGVCYALPRTSGARYTDGGSVSLLGVICQSRTTGKACFWDNRDASGRTITGPGVALDFAVIQNGSNLNENCTSCHRGGNVFNIHPGTALDLTGDTDAAGEPYVTNPDVRYAPIGANAYGPWVNPGPLYPRGSGGCASCHEIADTMTVQFGDGSRNGFYCGILQQAAQGTMPPPGGAGAAGWPAPVGSSYRAHTDFLRTRCGS